MIRMEIDRRTDHTLRANGTTTVSFVYPTRRPKFLREALEILKTQQGANFEVVVSDNYTDPSLSCEEVCRESGLNVVYLHPPRPLSMAENWEYPLRWTHGEYVAYLTDKMFVLPNAMAYIERAAGAEIISWVTDNYSPAQYPYYFGPGSYSFGDRGPGGMFDPQAELSRRGITGRSADSQPDYGRGKIVFGAFHRELIDRCILRFGGLFDQEDWGTTGLSPDYTSMILGLSEARSAFESRESCTVQIHTDISGGMLIDTHDEIAKATLPESKWPDLPVPGLYTSQHNIVARDYVALKERFDLPFDFNLGVWVSYIVADIYRPGRIWSSPEAEAQQKAVLASYLAEKG